MLPKTRNVEMLTDRETHLQVHLQVSHKQQLRWAEQFFCNICCICSVDRPGSLVKERPTFPEQTCAITSERESFPLPKVFIETIHSEDLRSSG